MPEHRGECGRRENQRCVRCEIIERDPRYREVMGAPSADCPHLGERTGEVRKCGACNLTLTEIPVYSCKKHGACTLYKSFADLACCNVCDDRPKCGTT